MPRTLSLLAALSLAGCASLTPPVDSGNPFDGGDIDAQGTDTRPRDDVPAVDVPAAAMHSYTSAIGPIQLDPGQELTMCVVQPLGNLTPEYLRSIHANLGPASHHLIFYRAQETTPQLTPQPCRGFSGVMSLTQFDSPMIIAQMDGASVTMPDGVGMQLGANQMVRIELHAINTTQATIQMQGNVVLQTVDQTVPLTPADVLFWGNVDIQLPANQTTPSTVEFFHRPWPSTRIFGLTSHTHQHGILATISVATDPSNDPTQVIDQPGDPLHTSHSWSEPPLTIFDPPLQLTYDQGLHLVCTYRNTTSMPVHFGESFNDEMCFMWAYYYPATRGVQVCAEGMGAPDASALCFPP